MRSTDVLRDAFERLPGLVQRAVKGLDADQLAHRPDAGANSIAWLVWHLTRIEDDHVADLAGTEQVWTADSWAERFDLPFDKYDTGYGHGPDHVAAVRPSTPDLLIGYYDATHAFTLSYLDTLSDDDLDRVVDKRWTPPVTAGVRLVSVIGDCHQHVGQACYLRGIIDRAPEE
jgi:uncharacterized damage-inducible protein DinB